MAAPGASIIIGIDAGTSSDCARARRDLRVALLPVRAKRAEIGEAARA